MNSPTCDDIPAGPITEAELRDTWNAQADPGHQWGDLGLCEQLGWAQARAVAVDRSRRGALPQDYIDSEHQGMDRALLEAFYRACAAEGGTADEIYLRGIKAAMLQQRAAPDPVAVSDRPWEQAGWLDSDGECWWCPPEEPPFYWSRANPAMVYGGWLLPHWAIRNPPCS